MLEFLTTIAYICAFILIAPAFLLILFDVSFLAVVSAYNVFKKLESKYRYASSKTSLSAAKEIFFKKNSYQLLGSSQHPF
ncbi:unnamed protein product [Rhizophagus irregularis]|nr:unnamed protein product [Rhizophagus irregularis]